MKVYNTIIPSKDCHVKLHGIFYQTLAVSCPRLVLILGAQCHEYTVTKQNGGESLNIRKRLGERRRRNCGRDVKGDRKEEDRNELGT